MEKQTQSGSKSNAQPPSGRSGKHKRKSGGGGKPIKVVYISNPMRVKTSAADFRSLVQELTGRHADPSKYSADDDAARAQQELSPEGSAAASTPDAVALGPIAAPELATAAFGDRDADGDEEEVDEIFRSQLLDSDYSVFSPPTFLYDYQHGSSSSNKV